MSELILRIALVVACALGGLATTVLFKMKKDNKIEEYAERVIEKHTGILIDLSPQDGKDTDDKK